MYHYYQVLVPKTITDMRSKLRGLQYGQKENATENPELHCPSTYTSYLIVQFKKKKKQIR